MTVNTTETINPDFPLMLQGPRLYLLGRTDLYQMNPGKLAAQAAHAATQFVFQVYENQDAEVESEMNAWRNQGRGGFGTKITLAATKAEIQDVVHNMIYGYGLVAGVVFDPTYPFTNYFGEFFTSEELTFGYVFAPSNMPAAALDDLKKFPLHS